MRTYGRKRIGRCGFVYESEAFLFVFTAFRIGGSPCERLFRYRASLRTDLGDTPRNLYGEFDSDNPITLQRQLFYIHATDVYYCGLAVYAKGSRNTGYLLMI